ncbi:olfactory receptor 18-like [Talpa occidentalis]|uniref:olfactory receptor 18-like n=1 Tax=Talpa occidentalis TaxID=50954 RepID=UPI00188F069E|nr:olfactory receptor 18-like [Talpa occidentalis]
MPEAGSPPPAARALAPPPPGGAREPQPARGPPGPGADHCLCLGEPRNHTGVVEFFLLGLSDDPERQQLIFCVFLSMYLVTVMGNLLIILAIASDPHLHTPMYFFLSILSVADIGFTSATVPKMISNIQTHSRALSHMDCLLQLSLLYFFLCLDSALLAGMVYDRFVAICHLLHYPATMNPCLCGLLVLASLWVSLLDSQVNCLMISQLTFCTHVDVPNFFCDPPQLIKLACEGTSLYTIFMYIIGIIFGGIPVLGILFSYRQIVSSVLRVPSAGGRFKAFSTCGSHLSVVCLFYGTGFGAYLGSAVSHSPGLGVVASVVYTVVVPILNPFIYSLWNRDIKMALKSLLIRKT